MGGGSASFCLADCRRVGQSLIVRLSISPWCVCVLFCCLFPRLPQGGFDILTHLALRSVVGLTFVQCSVQGPGRRTARNHDPVVAMRRRQLWPSLLHVLFSLSCVL